MNALERWIVEHCQMTTDIEIMNLLQSKGIISDECVLAEDVCDADAEKAVAWLEAQR